ncbi:MAG: hypothetical protein CVU38_11500 [Chloroflexi bacterium HGW-Chloroflexi-1]|nr:MAG: hypothetical protein CVU38_11500 [Chloroflexi bacterium HGW-Chloroflexi-1]
MQFDAEYHDGASYRERLVQLLSSDLDFHSYDTSYASHDFHPFPAKFPPQLPKKFILGLTEVNDVVLDPMMGSGTTIVEAILNGRHAKGFDIDLLARLITTVKTTPLDADRLHETAQHVVAEATRKVTNGRPKLIETLNSMWDSKTRKFVHYWFAPETQIELMALLTEIHAVSDVPIRAFLELVFSACIITKSGGVSLAFDLAHTRPHRAKVVYSQTGDIVLGEELAGSDTPSVQFLTKTLRPAILEFKKRLHQNLISSQELRPDLPRPDL